MVCTIHAERNQTMDRVHRLFLIAQEKYNLINAEVCIKRKDVINEKNNQTGVSFFNN